MRVGLLQCDNLDPVIVDVRGDYDALYGELLSRPDLEVVPYAAHLGRLPRSTTECDAWLIGGSRHSVYDDLEWVLDLRRFTRRVLVDDRPLVGVCFGHQMIGLELGAPVGAAGCGWIAGAVEYVLHDTPPGEAGGESADTFTVAAVHHDQVFELPDGATLLASSDSTPIAGFTVGSRVLAVQPHPEFGVAVADTLYRHRAARIGQRLADDAVGSLAVGIDQRRVADWIVTVARS
jgi:GMP synthase-like glutamine amidotransferase